MRRADSLPSPATAAGALSDRRMFPRYPAWLDARVHAMDTPTSAQATVIDISEGGALVLTQPGYTAGDTLIITLVLSQHQFMLEGLVLAAEPSWMGDMVHVRFRPWPPRERLLLLKLIDELHAGFEQHQVAIWAHSGRHREAHPIAVRDMTVSEPTTRTPVRMLARRRTKR